MKSTSVPGRSETTRLRHLGPAHAGHHDVRDQQVDRVAAAADQFERGRPVAGLEDGVAVRLEDLGDEPANDELVLDEQNRLGAGRRRVVVARRRRMHGGLVDGGQEDAERRALARGGVDLDRAAALLDDAVDGREAEAGAVRPSS